MLTCKNNGNGQSTPSKTTEHPASPEVGKLVLTLVQNPEEYYDDNTAALQFWDADGKDMVYASIGFEIAVNTGDSGLDGVDRVQIPFRSIEVHFGGVVGSITYEPPTGAIAKTTNIGCLDCPTTEKL